MCYSKNLSLSSLLFGSFSSLALMYFGNQKSINTNKSIGYYFLFVSLMQLIEYFLWIDLNCINGSNNIGAILGPILNHLQPVVMLILLNMFLKSDNLISLDVIVLLNIIYLIYAINHYFKYLMDQKNLCIKTNEQNHLDWTWKKNFNYLFYFLISFINIINFHKNKNVMVSFNISYLLLIIATLKFNMNTGELWCFMVTGIPLINLITQHVFNVNN
jgi:hypothetical protein